MHSVLDAAEARILGCLIEKELTTPEYYPLSLNSLTNACNQKSNRSPVMSYDEAAVEAGLNGLQEKGFARKTFVPGSRVAKYLHIVLDKFDLSRQEIAVLCEVLLRGPQTAGELRARAERMASFSDLGEAEKVLQVLMEHDPPLMTKLAREAGRKESRYMHLLCGGPEADNRVTAASGSTEQRIAVMEEEISKMKNEIEDLKNAFDEFKRSSCRQADNR